MEEQGAGERWVTVQELRDHFGLTRYQCNTVSGFLRRLEFATFGQVPLYRSKDRAYRRCQSFRSSEEPVSCETKNSSGQQTPDNKACSGYGGFFRHRNPGPFHIGEPERQFPATRPRIITRQGHHLHVPFLLYSAILLLPGHQSALQPSRTALPAVSQDTGG